MHQDAIGGNPAVPSGFLPILDHRVVACRPTSRRCDRLHVCNPRVEEAPSPDPLGIAGIVVQRVESNSRLGAGASAVAYAARGNHAQCVQLQSVETWSLVRAAETAPAEWGSSTGRAALEGKHATK